jgi:hypothetical protein
MDINLMRDGCSRYTGEFLLLESITEGRIRDHVRLRNRDGVREKTILGENPGPLLL